MLSVVGNKEAHKKNSSTVGNKEAHKKNPSTLAHGLINPHPPSSPSPKWMNENKSKGEEHD